MWQEIIHVLDQFGSGGETDPGNLAVRFLLAAFFWACLAYVSWKQYRRSGEKRDFYINLAATIGLCRELLMFLLEYGTYRGFFPPLFSYKVFPPLEHTLTYLTRTVLAFACLRYFLPDRRFSNLIGGAGAAVFLLLYLFTAPSWWMYLTDNPSGLRSFGLFWGDLVYHLAASAMLGATLLALLLSFGGGKKVPKTLYLAFAFLFLDDVMMAINISTDFMRYRPVFAPIRHNLAIWAIPLILASYWSELFNQLRDEKAKTEGILEAIGDGIAIEDTSHRIVYQNQAHKKTFGSHEGESCAEKNLYPNGECPLSATFSEEEHPGSPRGRFTSPDGGMELSASYFPLHDGTGNTVAGISVVRDVTVQRRMEEALRESEERYRSLFENIHMGITLIDRDYRIVMANPSQGRTFGKSTADFTGRECYREFENSDTVCAHCPGKRAMASGTPQVEEIDNELPNGKVVSVRIHAFPVLGETGEPHGFIEVVEDVTEAKRGKMERQRLESRLVQNQKLESLGVLAGGIAHDFNNLLMGILGNVDLAMAKVTPESPARPSLQRIEKTAQRAAELTNQMLAYSGRGRFMVEQIDLSRLVEEMVHLLETVVVKGAVLRYNLTERLPTVSADPTQLRQVVMNLLTNASDAIGSRSGVITVTTGMIQADSDYLSTTHLDESLPEGFYVFLEIADTGCGMDKETQAKIFDPFFTTKYTGRGLGLAAVLGIVRGHGGALKVYSEPGRGTTFKILFPVSSMKSLKEAENGEEAPLNSGTGEGRTILVVDDDETVRSVASMMLEEAGYSILTASDGAEGLKIFSSRPGEIAAVLLDLTMPHMDGEEAFRRIKLVRPDVPVILSSGYNEQDTAARFAGKGVAGFIQKPYRLRALCAKLEEVLGERR